MADASTKLYYVNAKGRAEMIRLVLAASGKQYEDIRFPKEEWPKYKPDAPFGQMPYMEIEGKRFGQSVALATYFAREFGFYGKTNLDGLHIDQVLHLIQDLFALAVKSFHEPDEEKKAGLAKALKESDSPKFMGHIERLLNENGSGYLAGSELSLADIAVYDVTNGALGNFLCSVDKYPSVKALVEKVGENERIKKYVAERPVTEL